MSLAAVMTVAALVAGVADSRLSRPVVPGGTGLGEVAIFYYPWYGTAARDGNWEHWQQNGNTPPARIASGWYPARNPYSSSDAAVVQAQMHEIAEMGVQTLIVSWWGTGSAEAARLAAVTRAAGVAGLRIAVHVEPYRGRTPATLLTDLRSLSASGVTDAYVYDSTSTPDDEWRALNEAIPDMRLFANTNLPGKAEAGRFAGLYTYDVRIYDGSSFHRMCASARRRGLLCAPSVGPGFDAVRATGDPRVRPRANGATYDTMWRGAIRAAPEIVTITSYNEWHEGTQIEPARPVGSDYLSYEGAYGLQGRLAQRAYVDRTAMWVDRYRARLAREAQNRAVASRRR